MVNQAPWRGATYLQDGLPNYRGTAEIPYQGVSGTGGNVDGDAGLFLPPVCLGYRNHIGGGNTPKPQCHQCDMLVPWRALNGRHLTTAQCAKGAERKRRSLQEEELQESTERDLHAYGKLLDTVTLFK